MRDRRSIASSAGAIGMVGMAALGVGELADWWARRGPQPTPASGGVVVVLGFPGNNALQRAVQRWRVEMALRARHRYGCDTVVFSGGTPYSTVSEASQMAAMARQRGLGEECIVLEEKATNTRENVLLARRSAGDAPFAVLVSDGMHARRARRLWVAEHGEGAPVVLVDRGYRPLDRTWAKLPCLCSEVLVERRAVLRLRRRCRG